MWSRHRSTSCHPSPSTGPEYMDYAMSWHRYFSSTTENCEQHLFTLGLQEHDSAPCRSLPQSATAVDTWYVSDEPKWTEPNMVQTKSKLFFFTRHYVNITVLKSEQTWVIVNSPLTFRNMKSREHLKGIISFITQIPRPCQPALQIPREHSLRSKQHHKSWKDFLSQLHLDLVI